MRPSCKVVQLHSIAIMMSTPSTEVIIVFVDLTQQQWFRSPNKETKMP